MTSYHQQQRQDTTTINSNNNESSFQLRGTHLYVMLDDIIESSTGMEDILHYLNSINTNGQLVESVFVKGAMTPLYQQRRRGNDNNNNNNNNNNAVTTTTTFEIVNMITFFKALSTCLPDITRLEISGDGRFGGLYLPVKAITAALQQSCRNQLTNLRLGNVILTTTSTSTSTSARTTNTGRNDGETTITNNNNHNTSSYFSRAETKADFQALAMALQKLPKLTSVDLVRCRSEDSFHNITLGPLVQAIAAMPNLQQCMLCETIISARTGLYLGELCSSKSIQKLWWKTMPGMTDEHIVYMVKQLKNNRYNNNVLRELTIRSHGLGRKSGEAIADLLLHNTTLEVINLDLDEAMHGLAIAKALHTNTSLLSLDVWAWGGDISIQNSHIITKAFTDMLQNNYVLKFLTYQGLDWTNPQIDFYLRLNRAGRQRLLQNFDDKPPWAKVLMKQKDDVALVYHFLSLNPSIVYASNDYHGKEKETKKMVFGSKRKVDNKLICQSEIAKRVKQTIE